MSKSYKIAKKSLNKPKITQINNEESQKYFEQGKKYMLDNNGQKALNCYNQALRLNPGNYKALCNKGYLLKMLKKQNQARIAYRQCLKMKPDDVLAIFNLGNLERFLGNIDQSINLYKYAIEIIQKGKNKQSQSPIKREIYSYCLVNLAVAYQTVHNLPEAIKWNERIIAQYPSNLQGHFNLAMCLLQQSMSKNQKQASMFELAKQAYQTLQVCQKINSENIKAQAWRIYCYYASIRSDESYLKSKKQLQQLKLKKLTDQQTKMVEDRIRQLQILKNRKKLRPTILPAIKKIGDDNDNQNQNTPVFEKKQMEINLNGNETQKIKTKTSNLEELKRKIISKTSSLTDNPFLQQQNIYDDFQLCIAQNKYDKAIAIANNKIDFFQKTEKLIIAYLRKGWAEQTQQFYSKAISLFQKNIYRQNFESVRDNISIMGLESMGFILYTQYQYLNAIKYYECGFQKVLKQQQLMNRQAEKCCEFIKLINNCLFQGNLIQYGLNFYRKLAQKFPNFSQIKLYISMFVLLNQQYKETQQILYKITQLEINSLNNHQLVLYRLIFAISKKGKLNEIQSLQEAFKKINQISEQIQSVVPEILLQQYFIRISQLLNMSYHKNSDYHNQVQKLAYIACHCLNWGLCSNFISEMLSIGLGNYHFYQKNYFRSLKYLQEIKVCKNMVYIKKGICLTMIGRDQLAKKCFEQAIQNPQDNSDFIQIQDILFKWTLNHQVCLFNRQFEELISRCSCLQKEQNKFLYGNFLISRLEQLNDQTEGANEKMKTKDILEKLKSIVKKQKCCDIIKDAILERNNINIRVLTLNYSGVLTSPYEYFEQQNQRELLISELFTCQVEQVFPEFRTMKPTEFSWDLATLDTKWKVRYSPFNLPRAGVKENGKMMNEKEFSERWEQVHQQTRQAIKESYFVIKYKSPQVVEERMKIEIESIRRFDLFCYKTFIKLIYEEVTDITNIDLDSDRYIRQREKDFSKPYLNDKRKLEQTMKNLNNIEHDVIFFQEANENLKSAFKKLKHKYHIKSAQGIDSIIILNLQGQIFSQQVNFQFENQMFLRKWAKINSISFEKAEQQFNINGDSLLQVYKEYVFFNVHLTSGKDKNKSQLNEVKTIIRTIAELMPEYKLILGGDFNTVFDPVLKEDSREETLNVNYYPKDPKICTCKKKRTMMQPQRNKANKLDQSSKDYFISELPIVDQKCMLVNGRDIQNDLPLLPNAEHPFDHYLVFTKFKVV